ncbi:MAG TPA: helix-turn-helix domain-containing protein [Thermoanaerobaculia bacterium]|jgi:DNA-binding XRE family transcriptional regulator|nr:helix-turn-helix domain-containing protein [Thermoanaerobaculia bacterium]
MRLQYDDSSRGLLISFGDPKRYSESREVADGVVVDFDAKGKPLAIELEDADAIIDTNALLQLLQPRIDNGDALRSFRERLGMTQQQLGDALEIPRNTIARWERDELPIEKSRLLELALRALVAVVPGVDAKLEKHLTTTKKSRVVSPPTTVYHSAVTGRLLDSVHVGGRRRTADRRPSKKR